MSDHPDPDKGSTARALFSFAKEPKRWLFPYSMLVFVPLSICLNLTHSNPIAISLTAILAIIPATSLIAKSTQNLSLRVRPVIGSLLNATFGNAIEFLIATLAIRAGLVEVMKASLIGSVVLNILSLIGLSMIFGGIKHRQQTFNKDSVGVGSTMLLIAIAGLSLPTIYATLTGKSAVIMSQAVAIILGVTYLLSLLFVLFTHRHLFDAKRDISEQVEWGLKLSVVVLLFATILAAFESDILVNTLQPAIAAIGLHESFVGLVIIAIITNIPEHVVAIRLGLKDNITLSMEIGMNSAIQIALFVAPILVFIAPLVGGVLTLAFTPFQLVALMLSVMIINYMGSDGICNWLEGVQLVAMYAIIATAFYFI